MFFCFEYGGFYLPKSEEELADAPCAMLIRDYPQYVRCAPT